MEEIKNLRASFTGTDNPDMLVPKKNKYGHTVLSSNATEPDEITPIDIDVDENGLVTATPKTSPFENPVFEQFIDTLTNKLIHTQEEDHMEPTEIESKLTNIEKMLATFDDEVKVEKDSSNNRTCSTCKSSIDNLCKFCPECGTQQISKYCNQCGYSFKLNDKFCSDCGNKR
jgi:DnaJ-class molecular chaperone